jgi:hypothetical protein
MANAGAEERSLILSALSNAGTPEASAALGRMSEDTSLPADVRGTATAMQGFAE